MDEYEYMEHWWNVNAEANIYPVFVTCNLMNSCEFEEYIN